MLRDLVLEELLLDRTKGPDDFLDQVRARLAHTEAKHGNDGWEEKSVDDLLAEAQEEAADIVGWALGAGYKLDEAGRSRVGVAMALAAASWRELKALREYLSVTGRLPSIAPATSPARYQCGQCRGHHDDPPAGKLRRGERRVLVCEACLLRSIPSREELERFWLDSMKAAAR